MSKPTDKLTNGFTEISERYGWKIECPNCSQIIKYTVLKASCKIEPFLYCNKCSNFTRREEDSDWFAEYNASPGYAFIETSDLRKLYCELEKILPPCPCRGKFTLWAHVKCSHCNFEFPYNKGIKNEEIRLYESDVIWMEGSTVFHGSKGPSYRLKKVVIKGE